MYRFLILFLLIGCVPVSYNGNVETKTENGKIKLVSLTFPGDTTIRNAEDLEKMILQLEVMQKQLKIALEGMKNGDK